ncbi:GntR family transcriptional regulator [Bordetella avium]|nr:GntR family transcriptional regulator [Bordetella avium]AZY49956.1 GntR family transcriptional regulator [Bordetella avium]AZY53324.1 GntR family transcriptional regulator [Bordetella avium]RIQ13085.1 GntR family transcriptional regulator [Bordetella avium]RIQ17313.1 GntR family transcriptional regulator [Bordetella avium]RIQ33798.1 GntR family transcriptional regulator [Bordetella avium]
MPKVAATQPSLADRIVRDIQSGAFSPGAWLKQIDLQERYSAKRLDVRRALDHLAGKRVLTHIPNRGYHVYHLNPDLQKQVRETRVILEAGAVPDLLSRTTPAKVQALRVLAERFANMIDDGTLMEQYEVNLAFHAALYDMCANRELVALIHEMRGRSPSAPSAEWVTRSRIEQSAREHFDIVAAVEARDVTGLQQIIREHILQDFS